MGGGLPAVTLVDILTPLFFYLVIGSYMAFLVNSAWTFSHRPEPGRTLRGINLTLVPIGLLITAVGVAAASVNAFTRQQGTPSTPWAIVMVAFGLGGTSLLLAAEGFLLRSRVSPSSLERRTVSYRSLSLAATTVPVLVLGALFLGFATCRIACP